MVFMFIKLILQVSKILLILKKLIKIWNLNYSQNSLYHSNADIKFIENKQATCKV